jgi:uncharacterized membrane protein YhaH (DUF805 family)
MDYVWFLFDFEGRINRVKFWLAALIIACWMLFLSALAVGSAKLFGSGAFNRFGFNINDVFSALDPSTYFSTIETIRTGTQAPVDYVIPLSFYAIGTPLFLWVYLATSIKRLHDRNKSAWWMIPFFLVPGLFDQFGDRLSDSYPVLAVNLIASGLWLWGLVEMGWLKGTTGPNRFGADPLARAEPVALARAEPVAQVRTTPRWDQHSELELIPHSAGPSPQAGMHVKREHD